MDNDFTAPEARILVVDDVFVNLQIVKEVLLPYKSNVDLCSSGLEAVNAVKENKYDLIFMDYMMPEMNGVEAVKQIRALGGSYLNLPIVAISGSEAGESSKMFLDNGFNGHITKPVDSDCVYSFLKKWIPKEKQISK